jgi:ElaB/YqjD/DUF883 family membrane-anchored ribosome-binding protein/peptidoglycan hydrolase-like protein with peptidoglycan-binding domain
MTNTGDIRDPHHETTEFVQDDAIDLRDLFNRILRGLPQIIGLALLGLVLTSTAYLIYSPFESVSTSTRITFAFPGFEKGEYPDRSKFQPTDILAPAVIAEALKHQGLDSSSDMQGKIRSALVVNGIVPPNVTKERDRLRATGQVPPTYVPDEYTVTLTLPRSFPISRQQRTALVHEVVTVFRDNFRRTYGNLPLAFGSAFATLKNADYPEYQIILDREIESITSYLTQLTAQPTAQAASFRSVNTNFSFKDLLEQTQLFAQIRVTETLGLIRENGLSRNRRSALTKLDYYIRTLEDQERRAVEDEKVVRDLLEQNQTKSQSYVLGIKSEAVQPRTASPVIDQGLIDSLLANDSANFLVRKALDAGIKVKQIQTEKVRVTALRESISSFMRADVSDQSALIQQVQKSLLQLEEAYNDLIKNIRDTYSDFANQQYGGAVRVTDETRNESMYKPILIPAAIGSFLGLALGAGLSLLGIFIGRKHSAA